MKFWPWRASASWQKPVANFRAWVEKSKSGHFIVRYRDGSRNEKGKLKKFTKMRIGNSERASIDGKVYIGKSLANQHRERLIQAFHRNELGLCDLSVPVLPLIEQYVSDCENNGLAWMTYEHYEDVLMKIKQRHGIETIADLCSKLNAYKENVSLTLKKSTIAGEMVIVFVFCRWLIDHGYMKEWPFKSRMIPSVKRGDPKFYTREEWEALESELSDPMLKLGCYMAYCAGLRKIELVGDDRGRLGVLWEDLTWHSDGTVDLHVRGEVAKGGRKGRTIQLDQDIVEMLGSRKFGPLVDLERDRFWYLFEQARKRAGINPKLTIHGLRHSFAKNCLQDGNMPLSSVQKLMGHSSITTTQIYAHHEKSYLDEGIRRVYEKRKLQEVIEGHREGKSIEVVGLPDTKKDDNAPQSSNGAT